MFWRCVSVGLYVLGRSEIKDFVQNKGGPGGLQFRQFGSVQTVRFSSDFGSVQTVRFSSDFGSVQTSVQFTDFGSNIQRVASLDTFSQKKIPLQISF